MLRPLKVLVVEDELLIAMDIEAMLADAGHVLVGEAASVREVQRLDDLISPDLALVDLHLAEGSHGFDATTLIKRRWGSTIIVYLTANTNKMPDDFAGAHGVIAKPFSKTSLMSAIRFLNEGICKPPPVSPQPESFIASQTFIDSLA